MVTRAERQRRENAVAAGSLHREIEGDYTAERSYMSSPKCYAFIPKRHQRHWKRDDRDRRIFIISLYLSATPRTSGSDAFPRVMSSSHVAEHVLRCRCAGRLPTRDRQCFLCLLADEQYPSLNLSLTPLQQPAKNRSERRIGTTMSIPSDPSQTSSSSSAASGSKPTGRSLSEILQTAPTGAAHPGVEEIRNIDPKEDQERVIAFTKVSHSELCRFRSVGMPGARLPMALALALARAMALRAFARDKLRVLRGRLCASHSLASPLSAWSRVRTT